MGLSAYGQEVVQPTTKTFELPVAVSGFKFSFEQVGENTTLKIEGQPEIKLNALQVSDLKELVKSL